MLTRRRARRKVEAVRFAVNVRYRRYRARAGIDGVTDNRPTAGRLKTPEERT